MDPSPESEVLFEGWMVKSPPLEARPIPGYSLFKARWRRRWFVLQQGKLPRQYLLNYYTDEAKKRLKGTISLDDCEQVEHGLVDRKGNYDYMFSINTRSRIYFLAVDTRQEMDTWVSMVCNACGLRPTQDEDENMEAGKPGTASLTTASASAAMPVVTSSPTSRLNPGPIYANTMATSPTTSISSPYIHISECFSGNPPPQPPPRFKSESAGSQGRHDSSTDDEQIYFYMPSVNTMSTMGRNGQTPIMIPAKCFEQPSLAYIDLDLPKDDDVFNPPSSSTMPRLPTSASSTTASKNSTMPKRPQKFEAPSTIYKTVDFDKTKAFNQTRKDVEEKRQFSELRS